MAITETELTISNKSYTNKDFEAVYTELLDLARKISTRYDPANSTEADPFVILLKLTAFVTDKVNYNVDKNILERFLVSCTQRQSMQEILAMLGYHMKYYRSGVTGITFQYKEITDSTDSTIITIPTNSIVTTTASDVTIQYVTLTDAILSKDNNWTYSSQAVEGERKYLEVLGSSTIQLDNLDADNRIYFSEVYVAENQIEVTGGSGFSAANWTQVTNLNTQANGSPVFMFGFDSKKNLPYIEFPSWIDSIIGNGVSIQYFTSKGAGGNVAARTLKTLNTEPTVSGTEETITASDITVYNPSAATNGADPEGLDASYESYKKIIGTFDTLMTCRDYANYIYNLLDDNETAYISNIQASDRRTDLNAATQLLTYGSTGKQYTKYDRLAGSTLSGNDLRLYGMQPIRSTLWSNITKDGGYNASFNPASISTYQNIEAEIADQQTVSHNIIRPATGDIFSLRNNLVLDGIISTNDKVTTLEQLEILKNVNTALATAYNARKANFGDELAFDDIVKTIETADSRIKSISLQEPQSSTSAIVITNSANQSYAEYDLLTSAGNNQFKFLVAQNLFSGRVAAYEWDTRFKNNYDMRSTAIYDQAVKLETQPNVKFVYDSANTRMRYRLRPNEAVQFLSPNYVNDGPVYPYGVLYYLKLASGTSIPADSDYLLKANEILKLKYTDDTDTEQTVIFNPGDIFHTALELSTTAALLANHRTATKVVDNESYFALSTKDEIAKRKVCQSKLTTSKKIYWIRNNSTNTLFAANVTETLLEDEEYLFISDPYMTDYVVYGSGTTVSRNFDTTSVWANDKVIDLEEIEEKGLEALNDIFQTFIFSTNNNMIIQENEIITLTENDEIYVAGGSSSTNLTINNNTFADWTTNATNTSYQLSSESTATPLPIKVVDTSTNKSWYARGLLDINVGPETSQHVYDADTSSYAGSTQSITLYYIDESGTTSYISLGHEYGNGFYLSRLTQKAGGGDLSYTTIDLTTGQTVTNYPAFLSYIQETDPNNIPELSTEKDEYSISVDSSLDRYLCLYSSGNETSLNHKDMYIMFYVSGLTTGNALSVTPGTRQSGSFVAASHDGISLFSATTETLTTSLTISGDGMYILRVIPSTSNDQIIDCLKLHSNQSESSMIRMSPIKLVKQENPQLGLSAAKKDSSGNSTTLADIFSYMRNSQAFNPALIQGWYMCADLDDSKKIELSTDLTLSNSRALYDANNIANRWTLPKIDFENSNLRISFSSKK